MEVAPRTTRTSKPGGLAEVALTLPVFLIYQVGVVFLNVRNATDVVTARLMDASNGDRTTYLEMTAAIGFVAFVAFGLFGGRRELRFGKLLQVALEGVLYAVAMGVGTAWVVGKLFASEARTSTHDPVVTGIVMSMGAGFYEELAFRVVLFGLGAQVLKWLLRSSARRAPLLVVGWALCCAALFSGAHYLGALGDAFELRSFVARTVLGLLLTAIYRFRGFAAAVWAHAMYDAWVLVL